MNLTKEQTNMYHYIVNKMNLNAANGKSYFEFIMQIRSADYKNIRQAIMNNYSVNITEKYPDHMTDEASEANDLVLLCITMKLEYRVLKVGA